ncbi:MAG: ABC transporter permease [Spirochaetae bacterium HGW-Spirochaetae-8]|nr:MAG: ABC transporter permease [Spirochaetae bacterium HGW-Spirochaetae-8]
MIKKSVQAKQVLLRITRDKASMFGLIVLIILVLSAIFADKIAPYHFDYQDLNNTFALPSLSHLMGTDNYGRDIFSRILYGSRISLMVGCISVVIGLSIGGLLGVIAAYYGGVRENIIMRFIDIMMAIPSLLLAIAISASLGPGIFNAMVAVGIGSVPTYARVVRASILSIKGEEFIEAAHMMGTSDIRIVFKHLLPNSLAPIIVQSTLGVAMAILSAASLSFIGLGVQPPTPEWGSMLSAGRPFIRDYWHIVTFPGVTIMLTILSLNLLGDGLRDALDPKLIR